MMMQENTLILFNGNCLAGKSDFSINVFCRIIKEFFSHKNKQESLNYKTYEDYKKEILENKNDFDAAIVSMNRL